VNLASLLETWGDANVLASGGALIGLVFGFAAQRTRFCARAAVLECCEGQAGERLSVWLLAFGAWLCECAAVGQHGLAQSSRSLASWRRGAAFRGGCWVAWVLAPA